MIGPINRLVFVAAAVAAMAWAQDRTVVVRESSVRVTGGDWQVVDGGCEMIVRIAPLPEQKQPQAHKLPAALCKDLMASSTRAAKLDQRVGNGAAP